MKITECEWGNFFRYSVLASHPEDGVASFNGIIDISDDNETLNNETIDNFYLRVYNEVTTKISNEYGYFDYKVEISSFLYRFGSDDIFLGRYYYGKVVNGEIVEKRFGYEA